MEVCSVILSFKVSVGAEIGVTSKSIISLGMGVGEMGIVSDILVIVCVRSDWSVFFAWIFT